MTTTTAPLNRLAVALLDVCQLADETFDELSYEPTVDGCEAARAAMMAEAIAFWQAATDGSADLSDAFVSKTLEDLHSAMGERAGHIVADAINYLA